MHKKRWEMTQTTVTESSERERKLHVAFGLSEKKWVLAVAGLS